MVDGFTFARMLNAINNYKDTSIMIVCALAHNTKSQLVIDYLGSDTEYNDCIGIGIKK